MENNPKRNMYEVHVLSYYFFLIFRKYSEIWLAAFFRKQPVFEIRNCYSLRQNLK
jgi:hypothetical protein